MISPVVHCGGEVVPYRVQPDLSPDLGDVSSKLDDDVAAVLAVHYFGFIQDLSETKALCGSHGIALIEDCAQAFFGGLAGRPVGSVGNYAIGSTVKFFATFDGGLLVRSRPFGKHMPKMVASPWLTQAKSMSIVLERALAEGRLAALRPLLIPILLAKDRVWRLQQQSQGTPARSIAPAATQLNDDPEDIFEPEWTLKRPTVLTRLLVRALSKHWIISQRRRNYRYLVDRLSNLPGCRPLYSDLPATAVPYVCPFLFDEPEKAYRALDDAHIPILHFGKHLVPSPRAIPCQVSKDYSRRVMQFPCHQELTEEELERFVTAFRSAMLSLDDGTTSSALAS